MNNLKNSFHENLINKTIIYKNSFMELHSDIIRLPNEKQATRDYLHHPGSVAAVPILDNGKVLLVKQYRHPVGTTLLEIPAGKLEAGEDPVESIQRELTEEIGYKANRIELLLSFWSSPGFSDEILHLYLATDLEPCSAKQDDDEFIEIVTMSKEELLEYLKNEARVDGKTALAVNTLIANNKW
ncbi:MAG TPA: NUDIX hydrolase [Bacillota bacterium]|nr:NUDIX hydrolase [Bacillota bacterium]HOL11009.1 NUDIX hydrolase [Bacillota bacterium]HPO97462.1 NUDIX hydrolase [Bacillota bacterium]